MSRTTCGKWENSPESLVEDLLFGVKRKGLLDAVKHKGLPRHPGVRP
jgi:hypothetical protein